MLLAAAAVWALPGGGKAAAFVWDMLGAAMLAVVAIAAIRFGREHALDLDRLEPRGRSVLYGSLGLLAIALVARPSLWASTVGSALWLAMIGLVVAGGVASWRLWRSL